MRRVKTKFTGVYYRTSVTNKKTDKTYYIRYKDINAKTIETKIGKYSEGIREAYCNQKRNEVLTKLRLGEELPVIAKHKKTKVLLSVLAEDYFETRKDGKSKKSDKDTFNKHLSGYFSNIETVTKKDMEKLKHHLKQKKNNKGINLSDKTVNNILTILSAIIKYSVKEESLSNDITTYIKKFSIDNTRERFLTIDETKILYKRLEIEEEYLFIFTKVALTTGGRAGTILNIKRKDINFTYNTITLKDFKNNSTYKGFFNNNFKEILFEYTKDLNSNDLLFKFSQYTISTKLASILNELFNSTLSKEDRKNRVVVHTLRHTFASHLAIAGTPIYTIQNLMNHKDIKMTLRYAKLSPDSGKEAVLDLEL